MNRILIAFLLASFVVSAQAERTIVPIKDLYPTKDHAEAVKTIVNVIDRHHYKTIKNADLNDQTSQEILQRFIDSLDPNKTFFLASDLAAFSIYKVQLDDYLKKGRLEPAFDIFRTYRIRVDEAVNRARERLQQGFDFTIDEVYRFEREDAPWALTRTELDELWRKRVKNDYLNLKMTGKADEEIRKTLDQRYERLATRVAQFDANDVVQTFINAYTMNIEPHTSYMSPSTSENFDISMRLSLEGIGAVLRSEDDYTVVQKTVVGGPAEQSGLIQSGDRIVGVGQGLEGEVLDIIGWRLQDVVEKIRGPKGSVVRLTIIPKDEPVDGHREQITLVRNKIKLEEQAAKSKVIESIEGLRGLRIGVIDIPTFYRDFSAESRGEKDFRSTTRDVRKLLADLKKEGVSGIVIDLRSNGGGSLLEATELTGLFIESGPVVQIRGSTGKIDVETDPDDDIAYDGPLAVLVNRNSASASEIFAGAIQDYGRGIIIGEPTFGKGTVQTLVDLNRFATSKSHDLGRLRLTMAQFFRISGSSTQHRGVVPDIQFPSALYTHEHGERSLDNALPWAQVRPTNYHRFNSKGYDDVLRRSQLRQASSPGFEMLISQEKRFAEIDDRVEVSLLESKRQAEWDQREEERLSKKNSFRAAHGLAEVDGEEVEDESEDDAESEAANNIELNEAARILTDLILQDAPMAVMR